jgi:hypothetical protein
MVMRARTAIGSSNGKGSLMGDPFSFRSPRAFSGEVETGSPSEDTIK